MPPHDLPAEAAVLSAVLIDPEAYPTAAAIVRPDAFYAEAHRRMFEAAGELHAAGQPIDYLTLSTRLRELGRLEQVGGLAYITEVLNAAPAAVRVEAYADIVARKARTRKVLLLSQRLAAEAYAGVDDDDEWLDRAEQLLHEVAQSRADRTPPDTMHDALKRVFQKLQEAYNRAPGQIIGCTSGLVELDEATGGFHAGESTVLAARPGMGKTALAMSIASHRVAMGDGVVVFSIEMPNEQLATRTLCSSARVDVRKARTNRFDAHDWARMTATVAKLPPQHLFYLHDQPVSLLEMRSLVRARQSDMTRAGTKLSLVVVDYLQLMKAPHGVKAREEAVSENARGLKLLSKELGVPLLVLSQLNRGVEVRTDKRPMLSDLRESGAIEEAADCAIGMYRDDYYHDDSKTPGIVELILMKQRQGPTGTVSIGFEASTVTFRNIEYNGAPGYQSGGHWQEDDR
jgi:replicative DNA helicase